MQRGRHVFLFGVHAVLRRALFPKRRQTKKGIKLVQAPTNDPDMDGYALLSTRWLVVGNEDSVVNFVSLFDDFLMFHINKRGKTGLTEVCVLVHFSVGLYETSFIRELTFDGYRFVVQTKHLPLMWGLKELTLGGHEVRMYIEKESDISVAVKWIGYLSAFAGVRIKKTFIF